MTAQKPKSDRQLLDVWRKQAEVIRLKTRGHTFAEIADLVGYADASGALYAYKAGMKRARSEVDFEASDHKQLMRDRLDVLVKALAAGVEAGDEKAIAVSNNVLKSIRELEGLDAPVRVNTEGTMRVVVTGAEDV